MPDRAPARAPLARPAAIFALPLVLLAVGLHTRALAGAALRAFVGYESPFAPEASGPAGPPLTARVVLVLLDGVGLGASRGLPFLDGLRSRGADYEMRAGLPSLSLPARGVMLTGAWQDVHGQISNYRPRRLKVEHVFSLARSKGRATALAASGTAQKLFAPDVALTEEHAQAPEPASFDRYAALHEAQVAAGLRLLARRADLTMVELYIGDEAGHDWGAASAEYRRATAMADDALRRFGDTLDLARETVVVVADHGHIATGGHGGHEPDVLDVPLVMAGAGIRAGVRGRASQADVAPTLSALLGLRIPAASQGRPLVDALAVEAGARRDLLLRAAAQRYAFAAHYLSRVNVRPDEVGLPTPLAAGADEPAILARLDALDRAVETGRARRLSRERASRALRAVLPPAAVLIGLSLVILSSALRRSEAAAALVSGLATAAAYYALLPLLGLGYSLSIVNKDEHLEAFFRRDMLLGLGCALVAALVAARSSGSTTRAGRALLAWTAVAGFVLPLLVKMAVVRARHDVLLGWQVPDLWWTFGFYLDALVVMTVGLASPLFGLVAFLPLGRRATASG